MRDLTKSMMTYGWAMSVFGLQQMINLVMPGKGGDQAGKAAKAFNDVTKATTETFDGNLRAAFNAGDRLQSGMVDMMFGGFMSAGLDPNRWMRMGNEAAQQMGDLGRRATQTATEAADSGVRMGSDAAQQMGDLGRRATQTATEAAGSGMRMGTDAAQQMGDLGRRATQTATEAARGTGPGSTQGSTGPVPPAGGGSGRVSR